MVRTDGSLEELDFLAPEAAAIALYQIAGALPLGAERRAIGRKVLTYLYQGNATTFAALAAQMALSSTRPLRGAGIRARIELAVGRRRGADAAVDRLALAILSRRELADGWVSHAATGSLPDRQLAGRLLERAAREAGRRAMAGDRHPLKMFTAMFSTPAMDTPPRGGFDSVSSAWHTLLADRETLVWRNIAVARGLLCHVMPGLVPSSWD